MTIRATGGRGFPCCPSISSSPSPRIFCKLKLQFSVVYGFTLIFASIVDLNDSREDGGWIHNRMLTNRRWIQCCSLFGICIEVKGIPWGALVIDSRNPEPSRLKKSYKNAKLEAYKDILSKILEKV